MHNSNESSLDTSRIESLIYVVRDQKIMLDRDLANLYGVIQTKEDNRC